MTGRGRHGLQQYVGDQHEGATSEQACGGDALVMCGRVVAGGGDDYSNRPIAMTLQMSAWPLLVWRAASQGAELCCPYLLSRSSSIDKPNSYNIYYTQSNCFRTF